MRGSAGSAEKAPCSNSLWLATAPQPDAPVVPETIATAPEPSATAERYHVYTSTDGLLWTREPIVVEGTETSLPLNDCEPTYVKVTAVNQGGESLDSPAVGGRRAVGRGGGATAGWPARTRPGR